MINEHVLRRAVALGAILAISGLSACASSNPQSTALQPQSVAGSPRGNAAAQRVTPATLVAVKYARNDDAMSISSLKSSLEISQAILASPTESMMQISSTSLKHFGETNQVANHGFALYAVDPNRMVYEISAAFSSPHVFFGKAWLSGTKTYVMDAQTGNFLYATVTGAKVTQALPKCGQALCLPAN